MHACRYFEQALEGSQISDGSGNPSWERLHMWEHDQDIEALDWMQSGSALLLADMKGDVAALCLAAPGGAWKQSLPWILCPAENLAVIITWLSLTRSTIA